MKEEELYEGPWQCYRCGETFDDFNVTKDHLQDKHKVQSKHHYGKPRSFQCHVCQSMYETEEKMNNHKCGYLMGDESFAGGDNTCQICDTTFKSREKLFSHNLAFHVTEKKFACDQCEFKV